MSIHVNICPCPAGSLSNDSDDPPVTVNKIRGPLSWQASKIGTHAYLCVDRTLFDALRQFGERRTLAR